MHASFANQTHKRLGLVAGNRRLVGGEGKFSPATGGPAALFATVTKALPRLLYHASGEGRHVPWDPGVELAAGPRTRFVA